MRHTQIKRLRAAAKLLGLILPLASALIFNSCTGTREEVQTVSVPQPTQTTQPAPSTSPSVQTAPLASPTPSVAPILAPPPTTDINNKLAQIFQGAVQLDTTQPVNSFSGDFNGDGSEDIAIVVKPVADKLADINSEVANWILEDPQQIVLPDQTKATQILPPPAAPPRVQAADVLLTVIHGHKETGWRNPAAQQTYLLKNAVGRKLHRESLQEARTGYKTLAPRLHGDIVDEELNGAHGCLFWAGAKYVWFPLPQPKR